MVGKLENLLHERDAASYLGLSVAWLQRARWKRVGPRYVKVGSLQGRAVRYCIADLDQYIAENTVDPAPGPQIVSHRRWAVGRNV